MLLTSSLKSLVQEFRESDTGFGGEMSLFENHRLLWEHRLPKDRLRK